MARHLKILDPAALKDLRSNGDTRLFGRKIGKKLRPGRQATVAAALPRLTLDLTKLENGSVDPLTLFSPQVDSLCLEVGFGAGEHLLAQASANTHTGFIGCEPFREGAAKLIVAIEAAGLTNIRLHLDDARPVMAALPDACLQRAYLLFPDPWHKKRHHKRRFVNPETAREMARLLVPGGEWRIASDIMDYVDWSLRVLAGVDDFHWTARQAADWRQRPDDWPATRYEAKAIAQGRTPVYLTFAKISGC